MYVYIRGDGALCPFSRAERVFFGRGCIIGFESSVLCAFCWLEGQSGTSATTMTEAEASTLLRLLPLAPWRQNKHNTVDFSVKFRNGNCDYCARVSCTSVRSRGWLTLTHTYQHGYLGEGSPTHVFKPSSVMATLHLEHIEHPSAGFFICCCYIFNLNQQIQIEFL